MEQSTVSSESRREKNPIKVDRQILLDRSILPETAAGVLLLASVNAERLAATFSFGVISTISPISGLTGRDIASVETKRARFVCQIVDAMRAS